MAPWRNRKASPISRRPVGMGKLYCSCKERFLMRAFEQSENDREEPTAWLRARIDLGQIFLLEYIDDEMASEIRSCLAGKLFVKI